MKNEIMEIQSPGNCVIPGRVITGRDHVLNLHRPALGPEAGLEPESVLRHSASVPCEAHPDNRRGKGISISSSLEWSGGARYVFAAHGEGGTLLAARAEGRAPFYDFAVGVDGGGDVLTHDDEEFDRVVTNAFCRGWQSGRPLVLVAMGLGADGGSSPDEFQDISLEGWTQLPVATVDEGFAQSLQDQLERLGLWNPDPYGWDKEDPYWGYGLKVPQIIALAVRGEFPFKSAEDNSNLVMFPRRKELKLMDCRLLREARLFLREGH